MNFIVTNGFEANYTLGFAGGLKANGVDVFVVSCDDTAGRLTAAKIKNLNLRGSTREGRPAWAKLSNLLRYYFGLIALLVRNRGATIHFTGIFRSELILFEGFLLNGLFRLLAGRYIYTVHNVLPHSRRQSVFFRWIYQRIYQFPQVFVVHTDHSRRQLIEEFGVPMDKILLSCIGLNEEMPLTALGQNEARQRLGFPADEQPILFFGKIDAYKGLDILLEAFDRLASPTLRLVIAGEFRSAAYRSQILTLLQQMRRQRDVFLHERFIPNEEAEVFFKGCDVLCLPYRHVYQSGLVFVGPRFGIPIVASDVGALREYIEPDFGMTAASNDARGIAEALERFFLDSNRFPRTTLIERSSRYRWESVCHELVPLYAGFNPSTAAFQNSDVPQAGITYPAADN